MVSKLVAALTLCYNEQTPNPFRWVWLALVLANMKIKSSWLAPYTCVWGSRKKFGDHFSESLGYHFSSSEPTPKDEQQRQYFCRAEQSKTPLGRYRRPFVKISSHENMGSGQKVEKTRFFPCFSRFCQNASKKKSSKVKLLKQVRTKHYTGYKTGDGSSEELLISNIRDANVSALIEHIIQSFSTF